MKKVDIVWTVGMSTLFVDVSKFPLCPAAFSEKEVLPQLNFILFPALISISFLFLWYTFLHEMKFTS